MGISFQERKDYRTAVKQLLKDQEYDFTITISPNEDKSFNSLMYSLKGIFAEVDHYYLGRHWYKKLDKRIDGILFPERKLSGEIHFHGAIKINDKSFCDEKFRERMSEKIKKFLTHSSDDIKLIDKDNQDAWYNYILKDFEGEKKEKYFFISDFHTYEKRQSA